MSDEVVWVCMVAMLGSIRIKHNFSLGECIWVGGAGQAELMVAQGGGICIAKFSLLNVSFGLGGGAYTAGRENLY